MEKKTLFHMIITTGFGAGYSPIAPGTMGALLAVLIWYIITLFFSSVSLFLITLALIIVFTLLGIRSSNKMEKIWGKDPSIIVVDEMVGVWIPLLAVNPFNVYYTCAAFILFRFFDILKPLGIKKMENLKGGVGIMMDDILSGIYSLLIVIVLKCLIG